MKNVEKRIQEVLQNFEISISAEITENNNLKKLKKVTSRRELTEKRITPKIENLTLQLLDILRTEPNEIDQKKIKMFFSLAW